MSNGHDMSRAQHFMEQLPILQFLHSCYSFSKMFPGSWGQEGKYVTQMVYLGVSTQSLVLNTWTDPESGLTATHCQKKFLWPTIRSLIYGYKHKHLEGSSVTYLFKKIALVVPPSLGPMTFWALGLCDQLCSNQAWISPRKQVVTPIAVVLLLHGEYILRSGLTLKHTGSTTG